MKARITQLITHPIKSCAGIKHQKVGINHLGLDGDRQFMLVNDKGIFLSQRQHPQMALIQPTLTADSLKLEAPNMSGYRIDLNEFSGTTEVSVWKSKLMADIYTTASEWFSEYLEQPVQLVRYGNNSHRSIDTAYATSGETVAFADGYPILITHQSTLTDLNNHLTKSVNMDRFRANIVVETESEAWCELNWSKVSTTTTNHVEIDLVKPCARCVMTGVEQATGENTGVEVFKTLAQKLPHNGKAIFGMNGIPRINSEQAQLSIGQTLKIKEAFA